VTGPPPRIALRRWFSGAPEQTTQKEHQNETNRYRRSRQHVCVSLVSTSAADTLILRDGTRMAGRVVSVAARTVTFEDSAGVSRRYNTNLVDALEFRPRVAGMPPMPPPRRTRSVDAWRFSRAARS